MEGGRVVFTLRSFPSVNLLIPPMEGGRVVFTLSFEILVDIRLEPTNTDISRG